MQGVILHCPPNSDFVTHLENNEFATFVLLGFWKANESIFPVLSRMAMDIISVQATSVASESAFSTSGRVLSIRRTRLTPASLEMYFEEEILDAEVQQNEAIPLSDEEIALDAASSEGTIFMFKMVTFMVDLYHNGCFVGYPLRLVLDKPLSFFYVIPGVPMNLGLRPI
ncbi:zinc finger BED domain-containing protein RICESLEEPER 2-like protein, partial [Tanacetum coccineum]